MKRPFCIAAWLFLVSTSPRASAQEEGLDLEFELLELRNIFALLLFGSFVGMPAPPVHITLQLLPYMDKEVQLMLRRINVAHDALAEIVSTLGEP